MKKTQMVCNLFLLNKNQLNAFKFSGLTPLHLSARNGHSNVVQLLIEKGALFYKSYKGNTPFHEAALNGSTNCMRIIHNVEPNILNMTNKEGVNYKKKYLLNKS
jgi:transient receptor potential cation channel subfamily A protein 1